MKKFLLFAGLLIFGFTVANSSVARTSFINHHSLVLAEDTTWKKSATWTGMSNNKKLIYKINPKSLTIYGSVNAKSWSAIVGGTWVDKSGKWVKISEKKLVWSADNGTTWTAVPDGTWQDADGDWCKFDGDWNLWIKKGAQ